MVKKVISKLSKSVPVHRRSLTNKVQICLIRVLLSDTEAFPGCLWVSLHNTRQAHASNFCPCPDKCHPGSSDPRGGPRAGAPQSCSSSATAAHRIGGGLQTSRSTETQQHTTDCVPTDSKILICG